jgi:hypothetical protein
LQSNLFIAKLSVVRATPDGASLDVLVVADCNIMLLHDSCCKLKIQISNLPRGIVSEDANVRSFRAFGGKHKHHRRTGPPPGTDVSGDLMSDHNVMCISSASRVPLGAVTGPASLARCKPRATVLVAMLLIGRTRACGLIGQLCSCRDTGNQTPPMLMPHASWAPRRSTG